MTDPTDGPGGWRDGPDDWTPEKYGGRTFPIGPLGTHDVGPSLVAIGFCPLCHSNARGTTAERGIFDCPRCTMFWYDERVGEQSYSLEDFAHAG
ncbi:hypothetical protein [Halomarina oriensis]|uniref:Transcription factor zinc-finger domain-containing protein n=1 Tax=Halomarina oriensis TaxID=671145 RepID=A0A6B0GS79_9EURY|nr:hypothetical protein [Halomarina oriensis]MWG36549.1 hypothetical protein [Halomarina oriensis]